MLSIRRDIQFLILDNYFFDYVNFPEIDNNLLSFAFLFFKKKAEVGLKVISFSLFLSFPLACLQICISEVVITPRTTQGSQRHPLSRTGRTTEPLRLLIFPPSSAAMNDVLPRLTACSPWHAQVLRSL